WAGAFGDRYAGSQTRTEGDFTMRILAFAGLAVLALGASACTSMDKPATPPPPPPGPKAELAVSDQSIRRGTVTIDHVMMEQDGWVVVHEMSADGKPVAPG